MHLIRIITIILILLSINLTVQSKSTRTKITKYSLLLDLENPCSHLPPMKKVNPEILKFGATQTNEEFDTAIRTLCNYHYNTHINNVLEELENCLPNREARSIFEPVLDIIGTGVSNLIASQFQLSKEDKNEVLQRELTNTINKMGDKILSQEELKSSIITELNQASKTSGQHQKLTEQVAMEASLVLFAAQFIETKILTTKANLKALLRGCFIRKVATAELAEMMNFTEIADIDPEDTVLLKLIVDQAVQTIKLIFRVAIDSNEEINLIEKIYLLLIALFFALLICGMTITFRTFTKWSRHRRNRIANRSLPPEPIGEISPYGIYGIQVQEVQRTYDLPRPPQPDQSYN